MTTWEEIGLVLEEFTQEYLFKEPYKEYINTVGYSNLEAIKEIRGDLGFILKEDETLKDKCLTVGFIKTPPSDLDLPSFYQGYRVVYRSRTLSGQKINFYQLNLF